MKWCRCCHWLKHHRWQHLLLGLCTHNLNVFLCRVTVIATWRHACIVPLLCRAHGTHEWNSLCIDSACESQQWSSIKPLPAHSQSETRHEDETEILHLGVIFICAPTTCRRQAQMQNVESLFLFLLIIIPERAFWGQGGRQAASDIAVPLVVPFLLPKKH